eukprot:scaffold24_cov128-Cylindrotheca_fusiformis.AAC.17
MLENFVHTVWPKYSACQPASLAPCDEMDLGLGQSQGHLAIYYPPQTLPKLSEVAAKAIFVPQQTRREGQRKVEEKENRSKNSRPRLTRIRQHLEQSLHFKILIDDDEDNNKGEEETKWFYDVYNERSWFNWILNHRQSPSTRSSSNS